VLFYCVDPQHTEEIQADESFLEANSKHSNSKAILPATGLPRTSSSESCEEGSSVVLPGMSCLNNAYYILSHF